MADRVKVIKGLEICANRVPGKYDCNKCPYEKDGNYCEINLTNDAIALLKEQKAVRPEREHSGGGTTWWNVCGNCKTAINPNDKFCHECGRAVKWNDR